MNKRKRPAGGIAITSLLDVLTIILIFLLVNYSESVQNSDVPKFVTLPTIITNPDAQYSEDIKVSIGRNQIQIEDKSIHFRSFSREHDRILNQASQILAGIQSKKVKNGKQGRLSLKAHESISYEVIDQFLLAASSVGLTQVDLITMTAEK